MSFCIIEEIKQLVQFNYLIQLRHQSRYSEATCDNGYNQQHELIAGCGRLCSLVKSIERSSETTTSSHNLALHTIFHLLPGGHFIQLRN